MPNGTDTPFKLSSQAINDLREVEKRLPFVLSEIERAESAGLDMTERRESYNEQKKKVEGMLRVYS